MHQFERQIIMSIVKRPYIRNEDWIKRVKDALTKKRYMKTSDLAECFHVSFFTIHRIIKLMRCNGIGILPSKKGYILSEFASQSDDLYFIRWCYGRRVNENITLNAARNDILSRWTRLEDRKAMKSLLGPIETGIDSVNKGLKLLQSDDLLSKKGGL
jgi:hypothetical protein